MPPPSMPELEFKNRRLALLPHESVLDCLLRHGEAIPYACKAGSCQACLVRAVDCEATEEARRWIKPSLQAKGYALACQWRPDSDVAAALPGLEELSVPVRIAELARLTDRVLRVRLTVSDPRRMFAYSPGQYLTLMSPAGVARSYSIANDYELDQYLELHVAATAHGVLTRWLFEEARAGTDLHVRGPAGDCFYSALEGDAHPLLLAATGTGLAPLYGIARDALRRGHRGPIRLYHGAREAAQLYYGDELRALQAAHANFTYRPCASESAAPGVARGLLEDVVERELDSATLPRTRVYLCGAPATVLALRKRVFLKGARSGHIHSDPFIERTVEPANT